MKINKGTPRGTTTFSAEKKENTAPAIAGSFKDEHGEVQLILANGNTQPKKSYDEMWNRKKDPILPRFFKYQKKDKWDL